MENFEKNRQPFDQEAVANTPPSGLCDCPECKSNLVYPVDWDMHGDTQWEVERRCPECEWRGTNIFDDEIIERYDEELDVGLTALNKDYQFMWRTNMDIWADRFAEALQAGHILPSDF